MLSSLFFYLSPFFFRYITSLMFPLASNLILWKEDPNLYTWPTPSNASSNLHNNLIQACTFCFLSPFSIFVQLVFISFDSCLLSPSSTEINFIVPYLPKTYYAPWFTSFWLGYALMGCITTSLTMEQSSIPMPPMGPTVTMWRFWPLLRSPFMECFPCLEALVPSIWLFQIIIKVGGPLVDYKEFHLKDGLWFASLLVSKVLLRDLIIPPTLSIKSLYGSHFPLDFCSARMFPISHFSKLVTTWLIVLPSSSTSNSLVVGCLLVPLAMPPIVIATVIDMCYLLAPI